MDKPLEVRDKSQPYKFVVAAGFAILLVLILLAIKDLKPKDNLGAGGNPISSPTLGKLGLNTSTTVGTAATKFLSAKSDVQFRQCTNTGSGYITYSATSTQLVAERSGAVLSPSSTITFEGDSLWQGELWGITNTTSVIACMQI